MTDTQRLYSVTSLTKLGLGLSEGLARWRSKEVAAAAYDRHNTLRAYIDDGDRDGAIKWLNDQPFASSTRSAARGTDLHRAAEQLALGETPDVEPHIQPYLDQYTLFLERHQPEFLMAEAPVYNPKFGYAGTCDGVISLDGRPLVYDIKTTAHGPNSEKSRPPFPEVALQLVAYRRATEVGVISEQRYASGKRYYIYDAEAEHEPMPETDGAVCLVVSPEDHLLVPVRTDDEVWRYWLHVVSCARWQVEVSRNVFGPVITAPAKEVSTA